MIAYHGSSVSGLKNLEFSEENSRFGGDENLVHGAGIYLTISEQEAMAYATSSIYTVKINSEIFDATDKNVLTNFILNFFNYYEINNDNIQNKNIQRLIEQTAKGQISGVGFSSSLFNVLSNDIDLYSEIITDKFNDDIDKLLDAINSLFDYKMIKIRHQGNMTDWIICTDHSGLGLEIIEEKII